MKTLFVFAALAVSLFAQSLPVQRHSKRRQLATYYVSPSGLDPVTCVQARDIATPKRTINNAASCLSPGDTLYVRGGTYTESLDDTIPSGTSWSNPVTVSAYPGEQVVIQPSGTEFVFQSTRGSYITLNGLIFDGRSVWYDAVEITFGAGADFAHHIRIQNSEVRSATRTGVGVHQGDALHRTDYNES